MITVPVELQSFAANLADDNTVTLNWQTASESDNSGFNILRSNSRNGIYERINDEKILTQRSGQYSFDDKNVEASTRYFYKLEDVDLQGNVTLHGPVEITVTPPQTFVLNQNYPNPFNPTTQINYQLAKDVHVKLTIYNMLGQEVRQLVNDLQQAGTYRIFWDARDQSGSAVPTGIYHYRLQAGNFISVKKMILTK